MAWFYIRDGQRNEWELNERLPAGADLFHVDFLNQFVWAAAERAHMSHRIPLTKDNLLTRNMGGVDLLECEVKSLADPTLDSSLGIIHIGDDIQSTATLGRWLDAIYLADGIADGSLDRQWADIDARPAKPVHGDIIDSIFFDNVREYLININDAAYVWQMERMFPADYADAGEQDYADKMQEHIDGETYVLPIASADGWEGKGRLFSGGLLQYTSGEWPTTSDAYNFYRSLALDADMESKPMPTYLWPGGLWIFGMSVVVSLFGGQETFDDTARGYVFSLFDGMSGAYIKSADVLIPMRVGERKDERLKREWSGRLETWCKPMKEIHDFFANYFPVGTPPTWDWSIAEGYGDTTPSGDSRIPLYPVAVRYSHADNLTPTDPALVGWGGIGKPSYTEGIEPTERPPFNFIGDAPGTWEALYFPHIARDVKLFLQLEPHFKYPSLPKGA